MLKNLQTVDDSSVDDVINRLLDVVNDSMQDTVWVTGKTNIDLDEHTMIKIKSYRITEHESYDSIIRRALSIYLDMR